MQPMKGIPGMGSMLILRTTTILTLRTTTILTPILTITTPMAPVTLGANRSRRFDTGRRFRRWQPTPGPATGSSR